MLEWETYVCREWAKQQREITRIYFYGSRVWGNPNSDSDLDILIVAHPGAVIGSQEEWGYELRKLLNLRVDINDYFTARNDLIDIVSSNGLLVFSRHMSNMDFQFEDEIEDFDPEA